MPQLRRRALDAFEAALSPADKRALARLRSPEAIQEWLDATPYSTEDRYRCPITVVRERRAHCFDGACFAALCLARLGHRPLLVDMLPWDDDDHVLAIFRAPATRGRAFGAIAKSNFVGLRYREPVYRDLRELIMSYFESFHNVAGNRTLRGFTRPIDLHRFDRLSWTVDDRALDAIADGLDAAPKVRLFAPAQIRAFTKVDRWLYEANLARSDPKGLFKPKHA